MHARSIGIIPLLPICYLLSAICHAAPPPPGGVAPLLPGTNFSAQAAVAADATVALTTNRFGMALDVRTGTAGQWPGLTLKAPGGRWDLGRRAAVALDVLNAGSNAVTVHLRVDNPGADGRKHCVTADLALAPGEGGTLTARLSPGPQRFTRPLELIGMRGPPGAAGPIDPANVTQVVLFAAPPRQPHRFQAANLRAVGQVTPLDPATFLPFIDTFGQYKHADWPGKTHTEADLKAALSREEADLTIRSGPSGWDRFGGWLTGPARTATGFFRAEKVDGRWWLIDPDGRLFWSHGIDCVRGTTGTTPITDRKNYFEALPARGTPLAVFYGRADWAPHGYYQGRGAYETFGFSGANLLRKYGEGWKERTRELAHRRLRSWGMNTIGNWSDRAGMLLQRTPYVVDVGSGGPRIAGSHGYWGQFPDPFDAGFREALRRRMDAERGKTAGDPWCLGYFVDNELGWGTETSLAEGTLASPAAQPAKGVFLADLKAKYGAVENLNRVWRTSHASWDALAASTNAPDTQRAGNDLKAFYTKVAEEYFRVCREEVKRAAPTNLYLGCRFAWVNDRAVRAAAAHCDVLSFNRYRTDVADFKLPAGVDKPVLIGEFHFGALDRGMFHMGLVAAGSQEERAALYRRYVESALSHPQIVGTHWFQYMDQATTGRGDGENYQIGFVDICDTPYPEIVKASRAVGYGLYTFRAAAGAAPQR